MRTEVGVSCKGGKERGKEWAEGSLQKTYKGHFRKPAFYYHPLQGRSVEVSEIFENKQKINPRKEKAEGGTNPQPQGTYSRAKVTEVKGQWLIWIIQATRSLQGETFQTRWAVKMLWWTSWKKS